MSARVTVAGSLHLDVVVRAERLPRLDETLMGRDVQYRFGGKGGNQAVASALMGGPVSMLGAVGDDAYADRILEVLDASGIERAGVARLPGATGMSVAIIDDAGAYGAVVVSGTNRQIDTETLVLPSDTAVLCLQNEVPEPVNIAATNSAAGLNARVILNAAPYRKMSEGLLAQLHLLIVNEVEAADLCNSLAVSDIWAVQDRIGIPHVIGTRGAAGLEWRALAGTPRQMPAFPVTTTSTHGAGDMFTGVLAAGIAQNADMEVCISRAQAAAALLVSARDRTDAVSPAAIDALIAGHGTGAAGTSKP